MWAFAPRIHSTSGLSAQLSGCDTIQHPTSELLKLPTDNFTIDPRNRNAIEMRCSHGSILLAKSPLAHVYCFELRVDNLYIIPKNTIAMQYPQRGEERRRHHMILECRMPALPLQASRKVERRKRWRLLHPKHSGQRLNAEMEFSIYQLTWVSLSW